MDGFGDAFGIAFGGGTATSNPTTIIASPGAPNLAIDVQPSVIEGTFSLDVSELDSEDLLGWGSGEWVNVVCDVSAVRARRGATEMQGVLTRAEAGELVVELVDSERRFDPMVNADALHAGTPIRLRAWGEDNDGASWSATLFTGELDDVPVSYVKTGPPVVSLVASDRIAELARWAAEGRPEPGVGAGEGLRSRVYRVLDEVGLTSSTVSADSDTGFAADLAPTKLTAGWDDITEAVDAELGRVWVDASNRLVIRSRGSELSGPVRGTFSDWHGEANAEPHCCYDDITATLGTAGLVNRAIGQRRAVGDGDEPVVSSRDDAWSIAMHRQRGVERRDLALFDDAEVREWTGYLLVAMSRPKLRVDRISPAPWTADASAWRAVCSTDLGDRWETRYHPEVGPTVRQTLGVLGIEHEITPEGWSITFSTMGAPTPGDANPSGYLALEVSTLDGPDVLAPYGGTWGVPAA